jgi:hypothetical protein
MAPQGVDTDGPANANRYILARGLLQRKELARSTLRHDAKRLLEFEIQTQS